MSIAWDSFDALVSSGEFATATIEVITLAAALSVVLVLFVLRRKYPRLTEKGFSILIVGFVVFASHFLFDLLDTLATKKVAGATTPAYEVFDLLDAICAFAGLFVIGFGFLLIARHGMKIWEGERA